MAFLLVPYLAANALTASIVSSGLGGLVSVPLNLAELIFLYYQTLLIFIVWRWQHERVLRGRADIRVASGSGQILVQSCGVGEYVELGLHA